MIYYNSLSRPLSLTLERCALSNHLFTKKTPQVFTKNKLYIPTFCFRTLCAVSLFFFLQCTSVLFVPKKNSYKKIVFVLTYLQPSKVFLTTDSLTKQVNTPSSFESFTRMISKSSTFSSKFLIKMPKKKHACHSSYSLHDFYKFFSLYCHLAYIVFNIRNFLNYFIKIKLDCQGAFQITTTAIPLV